MMFDSMEDDERELDEEFEDEGEFDDPENLESALEAELIEEWCPVCRDIKPHAVIDGDKVACAECNHEHRREVKAPAAPVVQKMLSSEDMAGPESLRAAYDRLTDGADAGAAVPYSIRLRLAEGDLIRHSKFGIGIVVDMTDTTKAEVLFADGLRRLVCGK